LYAAGALFFAVVSIGLASAIAGLHMLRLELVIGISALSQEIMRATKEQMLAPEAKPTA